MSDDKRSNHNVLDGADDTANVGEITAAAEAGQQLHLICTAEAVLHPFGKDTPMLARTYGWVRTV